MNNQKRRRPSAEIRAGTSNTYRSCITRELHSLRAAFAFTTLIPTDNCWKSQFSIVSLPELCAMPETPGP